MSRNLHPKSFRSESVSYQADPLIDDTDARKLAKAAGDTVAKAHQKRIPLGQKADGTGPQPKGKTGDKILGHESGRLARSFRSEAKGSRSGASATIEARGIDQARRGFLERRGEEIVFEGEEGTPLSGEVDEALQEILEKMIR